MKSDEPMLGQPGPEERLKSLRSRMARAIGERSTTGCDHAVCSAHAALLRAQSLARENEATKLEEETDRQVAEIAELQTQINALVKELEEVGEEP